MVKIQNINQSFDTGVLNAMWVRQQLWKANIRTVSAITTPTVSSIKKELGQCCPYQKNRACKTPSEAIQAQSYASSRLISVALLSAARI